MSVVKSKRSESKLTVIVKTAELAEHTIKICSHEKNFPKHYRWCLTNKLVDAAVDINNYANLANAIYVTDQNDYALRKQYQTKALATTYSLLGMMDISFRVFGINSETMEFWTKLVIDAQNLLRNWRKSDTDRYKNIG